MEVKRHAFIILVGLLDENEVSALNYRCVSHAERTPSWSRMLDNPERLSSSELRTGPDSTSRGYCSTLAWFVMTESSLTC